jgi:lysophospholipase L1-like esterase
MVRRNYKNTGFFILMSFLTLLFVEGICRVYFVVQHRSPESMYRKFGYEREPLLGFNMIPDIKDEYLQGVNTTYSTNSMGFRGKEEFGAKENNEIRVAILGGSCVFGFGASSDETTIASYMKKKLEERFPSRSFSVVNAGNPGYTSYQVLAKLQLNVIELDPDVLVFYMGWNDLFFSSHNLPFVSNNFYGRYQFFQMDSWQEFINYNNRRFPVRILRPLALTLIIQRTYQLLDKVKDRKKDHPESIIRSEELEDKIYNQFYDNMSSIAAISRYRGINTILITLFSENNLFSKDRTGINSIIKRVAKESESYLIDADEVATSSGIQGVNNERDHYHLTDKGNEFLAGLIANEISDILLSEEMTNFGMHVHTGVKE